ncbi:glycosyltransferase [Lactobacillus selangorensis]|uniref:Glycosyltransferase n=1 Tax=Lactobacillus selangorensis TaxID=81857 RepID=A0A0R2G257_9LACO|nr:glycosyltransferase family 2 protein [Lactobacillus selangorensis]KRN28085.1 glycosyltransferase [Lactobacillus selangorensis]KRN31037.1 glycosyltransferase [Lactobacillus selangorensis]
MNQPKLTIVIPAYNEEAVLPNTLKILLKIENNLITSKKIALNSDLLIVDDGSSDRTWQIIQTVHAQQPHINGIKFSRNFGHQNALVAGMTAAIQTAAVVITIDADLQDDPNAIQAMVDKYLHGAEIVYGVRNNRETDTWFKRTTANLYYATLAGLGVQIVQNSADFRLMSKQAIETFLNYDERNLFIRGIIPKLGFHTEKVFYKRMPRMAGESKYPLKKMLAFAWDGISSLTVAPIRFILAFGILVLFGTFMTFLLSLFHLFTLSTVVLSIWLIGGIQLVSLGVVGEYIGQLTTEVKHRPRYTVQETLITASAADPFQAPLFASQMTTAAQKEAPTSTKAGLKHGYQYQ